MNPANKTLNETLSIATKFSEMMKEYRLFGALIEKWDMLNNTDIFHKTSYIIRKNKFGRFLLGVLEVNFTAGMLAVFGILVMCSALLSLKNIPIYTPVGIILGLIMITLASILISKIIHGWIDQYEDIGKEISFAMARAECLLTRVGDFEDLSLVQERLREFALVITTLEKAFPAEINYAYCKELNCLTDDIRYAIKDAVEFGLTDDDPTPFLEWATEEWYRLARLGKVSTDYSI